MPDIFDFLSTRTDLSHPSNPISLPSNGLVQILPTATQSGAPSVDDFINQELSKLKPIQSYDYTKEQQAKYPGQYRPYEVLGSDIEDTYAFKQSAGEQWLNGAIKGAGTMGSTFLSSFLSLPQIYDAVANKKISDWEEDSLFSQVQHWQESLENKYPNYYSKKERENTDKGEWYKNIPTANFLADGILKNLGFSVGAIGAAIVQDAAITAMTAGIGAIPGVIATSANTLSKMKNAWFSLSKASQIAGGAEMVLNGVQLGNNLSSTARAAATLNNMRKADAFIAKAFLASQGEAAIEGHHTYLKTREDLYKKALDGKLSDEALVSMEQDAQDAGRWTAALNVPVLMVSNVLQFKNLLMGKGRLNQVSDLIRHEVGESGLRAVSNYSGKRVAKDILKANLIDFAAEGGEEGTQHFLGNSLHDYYVDRYNPEARKGLFSFTWDNAKNKLKDPELWQEVFVGGISGLLMSGGNILQHRGSKQRAEKISEHLNTTLGQFNETTKQINSAMEIDNLQDSEQGKAVSKALFNHVLQAKKYGSYDNFIETLNELKNLDHQDYNEKFNTNFSSIQEKNAAIDLMVNKSKTLSEEIDYTENTFVNPYKKDFLTEKIRRAFSPKTELELERVQEGLFEDWKDAVTYGRVQLKETKKKIEDLRTSMQSQNISNDAIQFLIHTQLGDKKGISQYLKSKSFQLKALNKELAYYTELEKSLTTPSEEKDKLKERIKQVQNVIDVVNKHQETLKEKTSRETLMRTILEEEVSLSRGEEFLRDREEEYQLIEELKRNAEELGNQQGQANNLTDEQTQVAEVLNQQTQTPQPAQTIPVPTTGLQNLGQAAQDVTKSIIDADLLASNKFSIHVGTATPEQKARLKVLMETYRTPTMEVNTVGNLWTITPVQMAQRQSHPEQALDLAARLQQDNQPLEKTNPLEPTLDPNAWMDEFPAESDIYINNVRFQVKGKTDEGLIIVGGSNIYTLKKEGEEYITNAPSIGKNPNVKKDPEPILEEPQPNSLQESEELLKEESDPEYLDALKEPLRAESIKEEFWIGDTFTLNQIKQQEGTYLFLTRNKNGSYSQKQGDTRIIIYKDGEFRQTVGTFEDGNLTSVQLDRDTSVSENSLQDKTFVQVGKQGEKKIEIVQKEDPGGNKDTVVEEFLGKNHSFSATLQRMINSGRVEIKC